MRFNPDEYVSVSERIEKFYAKYPTGKINTAVLENSFETGHVLIRAEVYREASDTLPASTGHAFEVKGGNGPNATSHIENAETSAVGRALALLGFEVKRGVASREEMEKANRQQPARPQPSAPQTPAPHVNAQIMDTLQILGKSEDDLNGYVRGKYGFNGDWSDLDARRKGEVLAFLKSKLESEVEAAR